jgi:hypothetical protein
MSVSNPWDPRKWGAIIADSVDSENPHYRMAKEQLGQFALSSQLIFGAATVITTAIVFFGMSRSKLSVVLVGAPLVYASYNMYRFSQNIEDIAKNPNNYVVNPTITAITGGEKQLDINKLEACLTKNTVFYFDVFVKMVLRNFDRLK